jgi:hypothetical protein
MKRVMSKLVLVALATGLCSGCVQMGAGVSGSSRPITARDSYVVVDEEASGTSTALGLMGLQLWPTSAYNAIQDAKEDSGGDALINMTGDNKVYYLIPPLFTIITIHQMEIEGKAIKFQRGGGLR